MALKYKNSLYIVLVLFCTVFAGFIFFNGKSKPAALPQLKERKGELANAPEWELTQQNVQKLMGELEKKPNDAKNLLRLAAEYMQEGRATGDFTYYNKSALDLIQTALKIEPKNFDALCYKAMVYLSQHRFAEGKALAMEGAAINPYNSFIYGLLVDANVELGDYKEAVTMCDKMVGMRPDIRSYSRISYLRELHGDMPGALEAIQLGIKAGFPGMESTEWARMVYAHLLEDSGKLDEADAQYNIALSERKGYPFAYAGLGRIAAYRKDYPKAIEYYERARKTMADASFFEELIDLYKLNNEPEKAATCEKALLNGLLADNIDAEKDKDSGHYSDLELTNLYLKMGQLDNALIHAKKEYDRRPLNIDACQTLAWVYYKLGQFSLAAPLIDTAMQTNYQNPEFLYKSGLILSASGRKAEGDALVGKAWTMKPYLMID